MTAISIIAPAILAVLVWIGDPQCDFVFTYEECE